MTVSCGGGCLFDLGADPAEEADLAASRPAELQYMQQRLAAFNLTFFNPNRTGGSRSVAIRAAVSYGGFWGPFLP